MLLIVAGQLGVECSRMCRDSYMRLIKHTENYKEWSLYFGYWFVIHTTVSKILRFQNCPGLKMITQDVVWFRQQRQLNNSGVK